MSIEDATGNEGAVRFVLKAVQAAISSLNTSNMGTINSISDDKTLIDVQMDSSKELIPDVIPIVYQGGGMHLQFPLAVGDKCMLLFTKDTVEDWLGGADDFIYDSNFDINNAFALVGINITDTAIPIQTYTDLKVDKIKIRNANEELITLISDTTHALSDAAQFLSDSSDSLSSTTVVVTGGSSAGTYPISSQAFFTSLKVQVDSLKSSIDALKTSIDTFKV